MKLRNCGHPVKCLEELRTPGEVPREVKLWTPGVFTQRIHRILLMYFLWYLAAASSKIQYSRTSQADAA